MRLRFDPDSCPKYPNSVENKILYMVSTNQMSSFPVPCVNFLWDDSKMRNLSGVSGVIGMFGFSLNESFEPFVDPLYQGSMDH